MIKNIVFDIGGVLMNFTSEEIARHYCTDDEDIKLIIDEVIDNKIWIKMDRGVMTYDEAAKIAKSHLPERLHKAVDQIYADWDTYMVPSTEMGEVVKAVKEHGYKIYLLSNTPDRFERFKKHIPYYDMFDGEILSCYEHLLKSDPQIYRSLFEKYKLVPKECVFIDDRAVNIEASEYCGMHGVYFRGDIERLIRELEELGVKQLR